MSDFQNLQERVRHQEDNTRVYGEGLEDGAAPRKMTEGQQCGGQLERVVLETGL